MKITRLALQYIDELVMDTRTEIGGILGVVDSGVVDEVVIDKPKGEQYGCYYAPNVEFLNSQIEKWQENNISFVGIFHTHFANVRTLSKADINYIEKIMNAMPSCVDRLFFPIYILPAREMICYSAIRKNGKISISSSPLDVID